MFPLDANQAAAIHRQGKEALVFALLAMAKQMADRTSPSGTLSLPWGMVTVYQKPPAKKRKKNPAAKFNLAGTHRARPERIDHYETHRSADRPAFPAKLSEYRETCTRHVEGILEVAFEMTNHTIHRDGCPLSIE